MKCQKLQIGQAYAVCQNAKDPQSRFQAVKMTVLEIKQARKTKQGSLRYDGVLGRFENGSQRLVRPEQIIRTWDSHESLVPKVPGQGGWFQIEAKPTSQLELDHVMSGGFKPGQLVVMAGYSGAGKSMMMEQMARQMEIKGYAVIASTKTGKAPRT